MRRRYCIRNIPPEKKRALLALVLNDIYNRKRFEDLCLIRRYVMSSGKRLLRFRSIAFAFFFRIRLSKKNSRNCLIRLHDITSQKTYIFINTAVKTQMFESVLFIDHEYICQFCIKLWEINIYRPTVEQATKATQTCLG